MGNRAIALCRAANPRLLKIPGNVIEAQKQNWMQLGNDSGMSKDDIQKLPKKIAGNLNKLKTTNVLVPEAIAYVSTVFHDAHMGMRTAGLLPAAEEVKELENISTVCRKYETEFALDLANSAAAQNLAESRGSARPDGEGLPPKRIVKSAPVEADA